MNNAQSTEMTKSLLEAGAIFETGRYWYQLAKTECGANYLRVTALSTHQQQPDKLGWEYHANVTKITAKYLYLSNSICGVPVRVTIPISRLRLVKPLQPTKP